VLSMIASTIAAIASLKMPLTVFFELVKKAGVGFVSATSCFTAPAVGGVFGANREQATEIARSNLLDEGKDQLQGKLHRDSSRAMNSRDLSGLAEPNCRNIQPEQTPSHNGREVTEECGRISGVQARDIAIERRLEHLIVDVEAPEGRLQLHRGSTDADRSMENPNTPILNLMMRLSRVAALPPPGSEAIPRSQADLVFADIQPNDEASLRAGDMANLVFSVQAGDGPNSKQ
jgi:hypothetical protein